MAEREWALAPNPTAAQNTLSVPPFIMYHERQP